MNTTGLDVYAYGNFGMALAFGVRALLVACGVKQAGRLTREGYLRLALLLPLAIVFFLPRMHERYFYLADILSAVLAAKDKKAAPICALVALASLGSYWETALPLSFLRADDVCRADFDAKAYPTEENVDIIDQRQQNVTFPAKRRSAGTFVINIKSKQNENPKGLDGGLFNEPG